MRSADNKATCVRVCVGCGAEEAIAENGPLWPVGWRCAACGQSVPVHDSIPQYAPDMADSTAAFDGATLDRVAQHERGHFWFEPRNRLLVGLAARFFPAATRYLEVGCGTAAVLAAMAESRSWSRFAASDLHVDGLRHARRRLGSRAELVQMDARRIPARRTFDLIGAFDVLEHIEEDDAVLRQINAALLPGGGFIAAAPQHPSLWSHADVALGHVRRYRRGELEEKLRAAGFEILVSSSYASVVLPLMYASRRRAHQKGPELDVHPVLNVILRKALDVEVGLTLNGVAWPAGGSRVVVARRSQ